MNVTDDDDDDDTEEDDDDDPKPVYIPDPVPIMRYLTFNEKVIMWAVIIGMICMCCKTKYCYNYRRLRREEDDVEKEFN